MSMPPDAGSDGVSHQPTDLLSRALIRAVRFYQTAVSPLLGENCRFEPTCSEYMTQALVRYGLLRGAWLGFRRLLRCHPFSKGGFDPVP